MTPHVTIRERQLGWGRWEVLIHRPGAFIPMTLWMACDTQEDALHQKGEAERYLKRRGELP